MSKFWMGYYVGSFVGMLIMLAVLIFASKANAKQLTFNDVDVSIYRADGQPAGMETVELNVDGCISKFSVSFSDLQKTVDAKMNHQHNSYTSMMDEMLDKAIERANNGCK